jgi:hypothetical protein
MRRGVGGRWVWIGATAAASVLACAAVAGASPSRASLSYTVAAVRGAMAQYHPSAYLPTRVPPKIAWVEVGGTCQGLGPGAPGCYARLEYTTRRTGGKQAFQLGLYNGHVKAKIVRALRLHDGKFGSVSSFTAGRFTGTRERQWNKAFKVGGVDTYVWEYKTNTYALQLRFLDSGAVEYPGFVPRTVIASFAPVKGATPPPPPPPSQSQVTMPNVIGKTPEAASDIIFKAGLDARRLDQVPAPTPDLVGKVVQTAPKPGVKAPYGSIVTLYIGT